MTHPWLVQKQHMELLCALRWQYTWLTLLYSEFGQQQISHLFSSFSSLYSPDMQVIAKREKIASPFPPIPPHRVRLSGSGVSLLRDENSFQTQIYSTFEIWKIECLFLYIRLINPINFNFQSRERAIKRISFLPLLWIHCFSSLKYL